jgi:pyruvate dehydrogenase phosphatase
MSTKLRLSLMAYVSHELDLVRQSTADASLSPEVFDAAIKKAFVKLDDDVMNGAEAAAKAENLLLATTASRLAPAYAGSCALLALYDPESRLFRLACTGDSRGVLGRERSNGTWETIPLSDDQTCYNTSEVLRLQQQHPNEPDMIQKGRVLGMAITRGFGDGRWKWDAETQELMKDKFCGESLRPNLHSPPYLTAEPVVSTIEIQPGHDFVILASDGLWDHMTNEQAVDLVGRWVIEQRGEGAEKSRAKAQDEQMQDGKVAKRPRVVFGKDTWKVTEGSITVVDDNAATHLARNALGGANEEMLTGMLTLQAPQSREVR